MKLKKYSLQKSIKSIPPKPTNNIFIKQEKTHIKTQKNIPFEF